MLIKSLPQEGEGGPSKMVDEDVGIYFAGKCFGIRSFEGVHHSLHVVDHGRFLTSLRELNRPYGLAGSRKVCGKGIVPRGLSRRPVPTGLCEIRCLRMDGMKSRTAAAPRHRPLRACANPFICAQTVAKNRGFQLYLLHFCDLLDNARAREYNMVVFVIFYYILS